MSDSAIAVVAALDRLPLNGVAELRVFFARIGSGQEKAVVTGAAYRRQYAHPFNGQFALLSVNVPDLLVNGLPEVCSCFRRFSSMRSKAPLKKSSSTSITVTCRDLTT